MDQKTKRTWVSILIASAIIVVVLGIALVGGTAYFVSQHVSTEFTSRDAAEERFERERQRFVGREPLIEMQANAEPILHRPAEDAGRTQLQSLRALAYDSHAGKLVRLDIPFWILRLAPSRNFKLFGGDVDIDSGRVHLTVEDVERHGPGLILDAHDRNGARVLVWAE